MGKISLGFLRGLISVGCALGGMILGMAVTSWLITASTGKSGARVDDMGMLITLVGAPAGLLVGGLVGLWLGSILAKRSGQPMD